MRSGNLDAARREIEVLERLRERIAAASPGSYWASQAETQLLTARAWLELKEGNAERAVTLMRRAAELEATSDKEAVTPGEVRPAGELLGDMLLELRRPADALAAYKAVLESSPNRLNALHGAARAAQRAGDTGKATRYYGELLELATDADPGLAAVAHAKSFITAAR